MDATASSSRREREGIISCLWQHSAIAFRLRRFLSACATACFHLGGPGELVGVTLRKKEIRAAESRPGCAGIETACPRLRRPAAQWGVGPWCPALPCGSLRVGAYGGVWRLSLDRSACGQDGSGAGILGNILGPNRGMPLSTVREGPALAKAQTLLYPYCCEAGT